MFNPHHVSYVRCHMSGVMCRMSRVTWKIYLFIFLQRCWAGWSRVWYQQVLLRLVYSLIHTFYNEEKKLGNAVVKWWGLLWWNLCSISHLSRLAFLTGSNHLGRSALRKLFLKHIGFEKNFFNLCQKYQKVPI